MIKWLKNAFRRQQVKTMTLGVNDILVFKSHYNGISSDTKERIRDTLGAVVGSGNKVLVIENGDDIEVIKREVRDYDRGWEPLLEQTPIDKQPASELMRLLIKARPWVGELPASGERFDWCRVVDSLTVIYEHLWRESKSNHTT